VNKCFRSECSNLTDTKYCSRSCSNSVNNVLYRKRLPEGKCKRCSTVIRTALTYCKVCKPIAKVERHEQSIAKKKEANVRAVIRWRRNLKKKAVEYKGGKCIICGYDKCLRALHFHHRDPKMKAFNISTCRFKSWGLVKEELDKCDLLCANHHAETEDNLINT
jgi:hypothetical protein